MKSTGITIIVSAIAMAAVIICGCGDGKDPTVQGLFKDIWGPSPTERVVMSADPHDADKRRAGIILLTKNDWGFKDEYMKWYVELLRTDKDPGVRSAAVRALGLSRNKAYLPNIVAALSDPSAMVRWDAAAALDIAIGDEAINPLRTHAAEDPSMDVRIACAKSLRHYRTNAVYRTLILCLQDEQFSVQYQAHASLVEMTGQDHGWNVIDWGGVTGATLPPSKPIVRKKPWWDWAGVTKKDDEKKSPQTQPKDTP